MVDSASSSGDAENPFGAHFPEDEVSIPIGDVQRTMAINNARMKDELRTLRLQRRVLSSSRSSPQRSSPQRPLSPREGRQRPRPSARSTRSTSPKLRAQGPNVRQEPMS